MLALDTQEVKGQMQTKDDRTAALDAELTRLKQVHVDDNDHGLTSFFLLSPGCCQNAEDTQKLYQ